MRLVVFNEAAGQFSVRPVADQVEPWGDEHHDLVELAVSGRVADDERTTAGVLVEQPLVLTLSRHHADLWHAEAAVDDDVVIVVRVRPLRGAHGVMVVEQGLLTDVHLVLFSHIRECSTPVGVAHALAQLAHTFAQKEI